MQHPLQDNSRVGFLYLSRSEEEKSQSRMGRPLTFETPKELQRKVDAYFRLCDPHVITVKKLEYPTRIGDNGKETTDYNAEPVLVKRKAMSEQVPYTITGLALHLKTSRQTLLDYQGRKDFSDIIKEAKLRCENYAEQLLYSGKNVTGSIFNLKNNYNWSDSKKLEGALELRRSEYEDLTEEQLREKIDEAMQNLMAEESDEG